MNMFLKLTLLVTSLILCGCAAGGREEFNNAYTVSFPRPVDESVAIEIEADNNHGAAGSTMMAVGDTYISVPTAGSYSAYDEQDFKEYGDRLAQLLVRLQAFRAAKYYGLAGASNSAKEPSRLMVRFNRTERGSQGTYTDLDVTFIIKQKNGVVFEKSYKTESGFIYVSGACWSCYTRDVAERKLNTMFFEDLIAWRQSTTGNGAQ